jgi:hypothetical protein
MRGAFLSDNIVITVLYSERKGTPHARIPLNRMYTNTVLTYHVYSNRTQAKK